LKHSLNLLLEQLDRQQDGLNRNLAAVSAQLAKTRSTRESLENYLSDYLQQQLAASSQTGLQLRSHDRFVGRIDQALIAQQTEVDKLCAQMDRISQELLAIRVQRLRYETLLGRIAAQEAEMRAKKDQKTSDEFSGLRAAAKALAARRSAGA
jgi:flagellar FliJ protein